MGEATEYFKNETQSDVLSRLKAYQAEAVQILSRITTGEMEYESQNLNLISQFEYMTKFKTDSSAVRQRLLKSRAEIGLDNAYKDGYRFLNKVGHYFNGQWGYSVTLFGRENVTFHLNEEDFLSLGEAHLSGFKLIERKTTLLDQMKKTQAERIDWKNSNQNRYNKSLYDAYSNVISYARSVLINAHVDAPDYNKGQILEGYMALGENFEEIAEMSELSQLVNLAKTKRLGENRFNKLHRNVLNIFAKLSAQTNSRGFWSGGDTKQEGQIKGEGASIFSYDTIRNQLTKFINITGKLNFTVLEEKMNSIVKPKAKASLQKKIELLINDVMSGFNATVVSQGYMSNLQELVDDINFI